MRKHENHSISHQLSAQRFTQWAACDTGPYRDSHSELLVTLDPTEIHTVSCSWRWTLQRFTQWAARDAWPSLGWWNTGDRRVPQALAQPHPQEEILCPKYPTVILPLPREFKWHGAHYFLEQTAPLWGCSLGWNLEFCSISHPVGIGPKILGWPKISFGFFCKMLWKNPNEFFCQPSTFTSGSGSWLLPSQMQESKFFYEVLVSPLNCA